MYSQYGINRSSEIKLKNITQLIIDSLKKEKENWAWDMWLTLYPNMDKNTFKSFEQYKAELFKPITKTTEKTSEQIMQEFEKVIEQHEGR